MSTKISQNQEAKLLTDIFSSPQDAFENYMRDDTFSRANLLRIHVSLFLFAPIFKYLHNLFFIFVAAPNFGWEAPSKFTEGLTTSFITYPTILFLVYHLDLLLLKLKAGTESIDTLEERDILLIAFLPFSASSIFWLLPKPINFFLILSSVGYSLFLSQMALRTLFGFTGKQFFVFISYALILCMSLSSILLIIFNLVRR